MNENYINFQIKKLKTRSIKESNSNEVKKIKTNINVVDYQKPPHYIKLINQNHSFIKN